MKNDWKKPPVIAEWLLEYVANRDSFSAVMGDFEEEYNDIYSSKGRIPAWRWYWLLIIISLPSFIRNLGYWSGAMFNNYIKIALRNIRKYKLNSTINILGLSIGIAFSLLVFLYVRNEYSFDRFHDNSESIYRLYSEYYQPDREVGYSTYKPIRLADDLKQYYSDIEYVTRVTGNNAIIRLNDNAFNEDFFFVDKEFLNIFSFPVISGSNANQLDNRQSIVISKEMADKYFPGIDPIGEMIDLTFWDDKRADYIITAVLDNRKSESSLHINFLLSYEVYLGAMNPNSGMLTSYQTNNPQIFIKLHDNVDPQQFETKLAGIDQFIDQKLSEGSKRVYKIQPIINIHLNKELFNANSQMSDPLYSYILIGLTLLILFIACINFMTLSIGRSLTRAKEVGIRKVIGAGSNKIFKQYLGESMLLTFIALIAGVMLSVLFLPAFNQLADKELVFSYNLYLIAAMALLTVVIGFLAGSYPAVVLSRFNPVKVLKGAASLKEKNRFSKYLVVLQFAISIFLIVSTVVIQRQINFMSELNLGFDHERMVEIAINSVEEEADRKYELFKTTMQNDNSIINIGAAATQFGYTWTRLGYDLENDDQFLYYYNMVSYDYLNTMGIEIIAGRNFSRDFPGDKNKAIILNESAVKYFGFTDPLNKSLPGFPANNHIIVGVVKDFNFKSLHNGLEPVVLAMSSDSLSVKLNNINTPGWPPQYNMIVVRINKGEILPVIGRLKSAWKEISPDTPMEFTFLDDTIQEFYASEQRWGNIVRYSSIFAIGIACLGLFGLSILAVEQRIREIGIRKVLGASTSSIVKLVSKDLLILVALSNIIAWPAAYFTMGKWLQNFAYKIDVGLSIFLVTGFTAVLIALITLSFHVIKAARANPVDTLKYE